MIQLSTKATSPITHTRDCCTSQTDTYLHAFSPQTAICRRDCKLQTAHPFLDTPRTVFLPPLLPSAHGAPSFPKKPFFCSFGPARREETAQHGTHTPFGVRRCVRVTRLSRMLPRRERRSVTASYSYFSNQAEPGRILDISSRAPILFHTHKSSQITEEWNGMLGGPMDVGSEGCATVHAHKVAIEEGTRLGRAACVGFV